MAKHHDDEAQNTLRASERVRSMRLLRQIADTVGVPVSEFAGPDTGDLRLTELMQLWEQLTVGQRDAVLREMRERIERGGSATLELNAAADKDA